MHKRGQDAIWPRFFSPFSPFVGGMTQRRQKLLIYKEEKPTVTRRFRRVFVIFLSEFLDIFLSVSHIGANRKSRAKKFVEF